MDKQAMIEYIIGKVRMWLEKMSKDELERVHSDTVNNQIWN